VSQRLLVAIPLCDYESVTTEIWHRRTTHYIVRACLATLARAVRAVPTPITLYLLADRCTDRFVHMAEDTLKSLDPCTIDNSVLGFGLNRTALPDKYQHIVNQFFKTMELSAGHDVMYFCEQDYLVKRDALQSALAAFAEIPAVNVLSPFDHPDRHRADRESEYGRHRYFATSHGRWKSVSSTNGNFMWRVPFVERKARWIEEMYTTSADLRLDFRLTNKLFSEGELLLCPERSLVQHYRLDGSNASPTYGMSPRMVATRPIGRAISRWRRLAARVSVA
jgi:hypothetical protein